MGGIFDNLEIKNENNSNVNHTNKILVNNNTNNANNKEMNFNNNKIIKEPEKKMTIIRNNDPNIKIEFEEAENTNNR